MADLVLNHTRRGAGEPLVLIHGIGGELSVWDPVIGALSEQREVIAVDLPGFGASAPLRDAPTPAALGRAVGSTLAALGLPRAHLAGNSLGAWVALEAARAGHARSVTGICPAGLWPAPLITGERSRRGSVRHAVRAASPLLQVLLHNAGVRRAVLAPFTAHPERVPYEAAWRLVRAYGRASAYGPTNIAMRQNHFRHPEEIRVPVTLAFGERDRLVTPVEIGGFDTLVLPGCGHIPMWDDPELITRVLLDGSAAPARRAA
jgi:pimeloyl-ACP methyl ester carboxylesterase